MDEENAESEEENPFPSGFGGLCSDTDDPAEIDSNTEGKSRKQKQDNTNDKFSYSAYVDLSLSPITLMILQTTRCFREKDLLEYLKRTAKQLKNRCC